MQQRTTKIDARKIKSSAIFSAWITGGGVWSKSISPVDCSLSLQKWDI